MKKKYWIMLVWPLLILVSDQWTKQLIIDRFSLGESIPVIHGLFSITYVRNTGAAFGFLASTDPSFRIPFFLAVPLVALFVIIHLMRKLPDSDLRTATALALVSGGAVGNLIDRMRFGYVVDFLDFHWKYQAHFPAFNVADSAICVGVGLLMLDLFKSEGAESDAPTAA